MIPKISIIMPVYNTGDILKDTIESILCQSFKDFELILVDDGSKDISPAICDEYATHDERIVVVHQANGGICKARNVGLEKARGEYVTFCDHDDLYCPDKLKVQYELAVKYDADIVNVGHEAIYDNGKKVITAKNIECLSREQLKEHVYEICQRLSGTVWSKLFNLKRLKGVLRFDEKYKKGHEDINLNYQLLPHINRYVSTEAILYKHIIREAVSTSAKVHPEAVVGMLDAVLNFNTTISTLNGEQALFSTRYWVVLAGLLRALCVYAVKAGFGYKAFREQVAKANSLVSVNGYGLLLGIPMKDALILALCAKKQYWLCYFVCKLSLLFSSKHSN